MEDYDDLDEVVTDEDMKENTKKELLRQLDACIYLSELIDDDGMIAIYLEEAIQKVRDL